MAMKYLSLLLFAAQTRHAVGTETLCLFRDNAGIRTSDCEGKGWIATAEYSPANDHPSNFGQLIINTESEHSDSSQMFAAGYLEGILTAELIYQNYNNMLCQVTVLSADK
jgi:hypothetical protein